MGSGSTESAGGLSEGQVLAGKYLIGRTLGAGGMCLVFEAEHINLRQPVALKILKPDLASDETAVARFAQEAQAAAKLRSPNVARVFDVDRLPDGQPYITMELLVGHDLGTELSKHGPLPMHLAADYVMQAATGIAEAHALGIVHRDLKPENLFLTDLGQMTDRRLVKILDFGIAKNVSDKTRRLTAPDAVFGTVDYMSPEQIRSASTVDARTDIWSLGVILYELLTGRTPYSGDARSIIAQIASEPVPPPSRFMPSLPPSMVGIVMKALAKDPAERFQSAEELGRALAPFSVDLEPISGVLARLPPQSVPRRGVISRPTAESFREARTNLSFETIDARKGWNKKILFFPLGFAVFASLAGFALWKGGAPAMLGQPAAAVAPPAATTALPSDPANEPAPAESGQPEATPPPPESEPPAPTVEATAPSAPATTATSPKTAKPPFTKPRPRPTGRPPPSPAPAPTLPKHI